MENFRQWMQSNYTHNELADIANHGCSGGVGGMIYYTETEALYKRFAEDLHSIIAEYQDDTGETPKYIANELGDYAQFCNAVVWFCAEYVAFSITEGLYIEEVTA